MKLSKKILAIFVLTIFIALAVFINTSASYNNLGIPFSADLYYGRNYLKTLNNSTNLVAAYDELVKGIQNSQEDILLTNKNIFVSEAEMDFILAVYRFDNPQVFWVEKYQYYGKDNTGYSYGAHIIYNAELNTADAKTQFNNALNNFLAKCNITPSMSQYQKSKILHDKMAEHITYKNTKNAHNVYGALVEANAMCDGYAELYQYLLYLNGISSHVVTGKSNGEGHAWNLVRIDGKYYYTDVTWDDRANATLYNYFNITTAQISKDHTFDDNGYPLPVCNSTDASYGNNSGENEEIASVAGDADGNGTLNKADAIYLLYNTLFGDEKYPLSCNCDFTNDGKVTGNDVIYLNNHILYGQQKYPIN